METIDKGFENYKPYTSKCTICTHFDSIHFTCVAFPNSIPSKFLSGTAVHDKIETGQTGEVTLTLS
jgi:hypothetical protein